MHEDAPQGVRGLARAESVGQLLPFAARALTELLEADACAISRVVGDVLIQVAEYADDGRTLVLGHGYLITDFPVTESALRNDEPAVVSVLDPEPDPGEAALLGELGLDSLLMLPLSGPTGPWGLAEVYVNGRNFDGDEIARARGVAEAFGEQLAALPASASAR